MLILGFTLLLTVMVQIRTKEPNVMNTPESEKGDNLTTVEPRFNEVPRD